MGHCEMKFGRRGFGGPADLSLLFQPHVRVGLSIRVSGGPWVGLGWAPGCEGWGGGPALTRVGFGVVCLASRLDQVLPVDESGSLADPSGLVPFCFGVPRLGQDSSG